MWLSIGAPAAGGGDAPAAATEEKKEEKKEETEESDDDMGFSKSCVNELFWSFLNAPQNFIVFFLIKLGFTQRKAEQPLLGMELQEKEYKKIKDSATEGGSHDKSL